ncbi:hypothetical protein HOT99_gp181 [Caulobacter phage CcrBL10]|uniref:Uncharacterized protein n=1 Tax=Caulobacter phage CcrBL10 TaxID=2283269 RepID=A0A385E9N2_9CAUD|nr:hypothetical protein HOT99_gp181 [Caulobacter phage CcrBL10]AXQ68436.1 hypothetical protein CcrBL10_gp232 [Caulobacter phage CcrBL10]
MRTPRFLNRWRDGDIAEEKAFQTKGLAFAHAARIASRLGEIVRVEHQEPISQASPNWAVVEKWSFHPDGRMTRDLKKEVL